MAARNPIVFGVLDWGGPVGVGGQGASYATLGAVIKRSHREDDATVANEYICNRLALALALPVPPGLLVRDGPDGIAFASVQFGSLVEPPPPANLRALVADEPRLAAGIVAFDCWVGNPDRSPNNMAYLKGRFPVTIFDHGLCLAGIERKDIPFLPQRVVPYSSVLATKLTTAKDLDAWALAIRAMPTVAIDAILDETVGIDLLSAEEASSIREYLLQRRNNLGTLLRAACDHLTNWGMFT